MFTTSEPASVLVVAAHPDDEVLGCGGTIARHADSGDQVHVLIVGKELLHDNKIVILVIIYQSSRVCTRQLKNLD